MNAIDILNTEERTAAIKDLFGTTGENVSVCPNFNCDNGKNIHVGEQFLMNYNGIILDVAEVRIGYHVMIGLNTMITTVNHPLTPQGRRDNIGIAKPVTIGSDVWIGGNVTILPG